MPFLKRQNSVFLTTLIGLILIGILICLPTGYEDALIYQGTERAVGKVVETDNSAIITSGLIQSGEQSCMLEIENGNFKGKILEGVNFLSGSLEKDKIFKEGDRALLTISCQGDTIRSVVISDHYRLDKEVILLAVFAVFLIIFAGKIGFQAILSFFITILMIWKILVPCYLKGYSPVWVGIGITAVLTAIIIFFVYGLDKRTLTAVSGALLGITTTCILGILFTGLFKIHGAVMTSSESLLYSGYQDLDLTSIFYGKHIYRRIGSHDGSGGGHHLRRLGGDRQEAGYQRPGSHSVGTPCGKGRHGYYDDHPSVSIFRRVYFIVNGVYGPGNPGGSYPEL